MGLIYRSKKVKIHKKLCGNYIDNHYIYHVGCPQTNDGIFRHEFLFELRTKGVNSREREREREREISGK
ncbi:hypothetical protein L2E82_39460 [Cichorium intybus]|uniref:Uncharacterized protein n=1 Tax=Cichorium intybus TaxID=13427 RepID=A0ACB9AHJ5_CICIN|nr:hypothetical protein L2E82_39460 [Cichorium intybus]